MILRNAPSLNSRVRAVVGAAIFFAFVLLISVPHVRQGTRLFMPRRQGAASVRRDVRTPPADKQYYEAADLYVGSEFAPHPPVRRPRPEQIALLMGATRTASSYFSQVIDLAAANRRAYAERHGYRFVYVDLDKYHEATKPVVYAKIPAIADVFKQFPDVQWVWWLDLDAIIMDFDVELVDAVLAPNALANHLVNHTLLNWNRKTTKVWSEAQPQNLANVDVVIAQDHNELNAGSFMLRRSLFTEHLLDIWGDHFYWRYLGGVLVQKEQSVLNHLVSERHSFKRHIGVIPLGIINAYPIGGDLGWREGRVAIHFAGCWVENKCARQWTSFWDKHVKLLESRGTPINYTLLATPVYGNATALEGMASITSSSSTLSTTTTSQASSSSASLLSMPHGTTIMINRQ